MPFRVYRVPASARAGMEKALGDDVLSRQSLQVRDARHFGEGGDALYLFVEGSEAGMARADALLLEFAERAPDGAALRDRLRQEEDEAASGLGSVFEGL